MSADGPPPGTLQVSQRLASRSQAPPFLAMNCWLQAMRAARVGPEPARAGCRAHKGPSPEPQLPRPSPKAPERPEAQKVPKRAVCVGFSGGFSRALRKRARPESPPAALPGASPVPRLTEGPSPVPRPRSPHQLAGPRPRPVPGSARLGWIPRSPIHFWPDSPYPNFLVQNDRNLRCSLCAHPLGRRSLILARKSGAKMS